MELTKEQVSLILNEEGIYDCNLITRQFAYNFLRDQVSPLGDIFCFHAPLQVGPLNIEEAIVLTGELPSMSMFGAVCFQRLYATMIGSLLSVLTGKEYYVEDSCILSEGLQLSISIVNKVKDSVVFHMIFPIIMYKTFDKFGRIELDLQLTADFKHNAIESFKHLTKSIFVETRRDNF
jgi:hypothetical protein